MSTDAPQHLLDIESTPRVFIDRVLERALALKAGERHDFRAPKKIWKRLVDSVLRLESEGGAMRYRGGSL